MGQITYAVMFGARKRPPERLTEGWYSVTENYPAGAGALKPSTGGEDSDYFVGFWIAVGASGKRGVPDLDVSFALDNIESVPAYRAQVKRARAAWPAFAEWARKTHKITLPEPRLWLMQTEVA